MISLLVIVWVVVVMGDIITTLIGVSRGLREAMPWLRRLLGEDDGYAFFMTMVLLGLVGGGAILGLYHWHPWSGYALAVGAIAWRGRIVYRNIVLIRGAK